MYTVNSVNTTSETNSVVKISVVIIEIQISEISIFLNFLF